MSTYSENRKKERKNPRRKRPRKKSLKSNAQINDRIIYMNSRREIIKVTDTYRVIEVSALNGIVNMKLLATGKSPLSALRNARLSKDFDGEAILKEFDGDDALQAKFLKRTKSATYYLSKNLSIQDFAKII